MPTINVKKESIYRYSQNCNKTNYPFDSGGKKCQNPGYCNGIAHTPKNTALPYTDSA